MQNDDRTFADGVARRLDELRTRAADLIARTENIGPGDDELTRAAAEVAAKLRTAEKSVGEVRSAEDSVSNEFRNRVSVACAELRIEVGSLEVLLRDRQPDRGL